MHKSPDGDTLGSAFALCFSLQKLNKQAKVLCSDEIPKKYDFLFENIKEQNFESNYIISVDVSDTQLLGEKLSCYADKIDLCIDHHHSNNHFSKFEYVESSSAATAEIIYEIIKSLKGKVTILLTTHYLDEVEHLADYIAIMKEGKIVASGSLHEILEKTNTNFLEEAFVLLSKKGGVKHE